MKRNASTIARRGAVVIALVAASAIGLASCGGSGDDAAASKEPDPTVEPGSASIDSFVVPESVACNGATSANVSVQYGITGAESQRLLVDGRPSDLPTANGTIDAEVHCDDLPHTFVLYALDDAGRPTTQQKLVKTVLSAA
jgi:hypothetical protein